MINGNARDNTVAGGPGDDIVQGNGGSNTLYFPAAVYPLHSPTYKRATSTRPVATRKTGSWICTQRSESTKALPGTPVSHKTAKPRADAITPLRALA